MHLSYLILLISKQILQWKLKNCCYCLQVIKQLTHSWPMQARKREIHFQGQYLMPKSTWHSPCINFPQPILGRSDVVTHRIHFFYLLRNFSYLKREGWPFNVCKGTWARGVNLELLLTLLILVIYLTVTPI